MMVERGVGQCTNKCPFKLLPISLSLSPPLSLSLYID